MAETTMIAAALVTAKADADDWFLKMGEAAKAAKNLSTDITSNSKDVERISWMKLRMVSQKLLYLFDDRLTIGEELKKVQNMFGEYDSRSEDLKMSIALLEEGVNLAKSGKARCAKNFEIKLQRKGMELDSIKNNITMAHILPIGISSSSSSELEEKKAAVVEKIASYREREANELASFESKIKECNDQLEKKTRKLKWNEPNLVVAGEALKVMKDALRCCEEAINMLKLVFVHRVRKWNGERVRVDEAADVGIIKRIYVMKHHLREFQLNFTVSTVELCKEISNIYRGPNLGVDRSYQLSIDQGGVFHNLTKPKIFFGPRFSLHS